MGKASAIRGSRRANSGASLPLALMLFLICALLASVVLAASTASSGRHSHMAQMDRHYYSVVSAAQLVQDEFQKQEVVVTCTQEKTVTTRMRYSGSSVSQTTSESIDSLTVTMKTAGPTHATTKEVFQGSGSGALRIDGLTLPERTALCVMLGKNMADIQASPSASAEDLWDDALFNEGNNVAVGTYTMGHSITANSSSVSPDDIARILEVTLHEEADADGALTFEISSKPKNEKDDPYSVVLACDADIDTVEEQSATEPEVTTTASVRTETKKVTTTRTTTIRWSGAGVTKGDAE